MSEKNPLNKNIEQKFLPLFPEKIADAFAWQANNGIEQIYLSHPSEEYNLRIRSKDMLHTPTLKNKGDQTSIGLRRLEVNGLLSKKRFEYYNQGLPAIHKRRATPYENIDIDFFADGHIQLESENPESWRQFIKEYGMENDFIEVTGDRIVDNEWRAHMLYRRNNGGHEILMPKPDLDINKLKADILRVYREQSRVTIAVGGRSGSGKSTLVRQLRKQLREEKLTTAVLSTDDYNYGNTHLYKIGGGTWENYDSSATYDLTLCQSHLGRLANGLVIPRHSYDFVSQEPHIDGMVYPAKVIFIEGIKANHSKFRELVDLYYEVPTSLATSIGRRIVRDIAERPLFSPEQNLTKYLEHTEPEYRALL